MLSPDEQDPGPDGLGGGPLDTGDPPAVEEACWDPVPVSLGHAEAKWPDPEEGPFLAESWWAEVDGHLECVGLRLSSIREVVSADGDEHSYLPVCDRFRPVTPTLLRRVRWGAMLDRYRAHYRSAVVSLGLPDQRREAIDAEFRSDGMDPELLTDEEWLSAIPRAEQDEALSFQSTYPESRPRPASSRGGRPPMHTEDDWRRRAEVYLDAARRGLPPNKRLAEVFGVHLTRAQSWTQQMRRKGYLPPAPGPGRPGTLRDRSTRYGPSSDPRFQQ